MREMRDPQLRPGRCAPGSGRLQSSRPVCLALRYRAPLILAKTWTVSSFMLTPSCFIASGLAVVKLLRIINQCENLLKTPDTLLKRCTDHNK